MFSWVDGILVAGFLLALLQFHIHDRSKMMLFRALIAAIYALYFYLMGAYVGAAVTVTGIVSGLVQGMISEERLKQTFWFRNGVAVLLSVVAVILLYGQASDVLPLVAVVFAKSGEAQACQQRIRLFLALSVSCWIVYAAGAGMVAMIITETMLLLSCLFAMWKVEQERKKLVPIRVTSS